MWFMTPFSLKRSLPTFGGTYRSHLRDKRQGRYALRKFWYWSTKLHGIAVQSLTLLPPHGLQVSELVESWQPLWLPTFRLKILPQSSRQNIKRELISETLIPNLTECTRLKTDDSKWRYNRITLKTKDFRLISISVTYK